MSPSSRSRSKPSRLCNHRCRYSFGILVSFLLLLSFLFGTNLSVKLYDEDTSPTATTSRRWAYVFLLSDCHPDRKHYLGLYYNILAASYILTLQDSETAPAVDSEQSPFLQSKVVPTDVVVLVQMSSGSPMDRLPPAEEALLHKLHIQIRYLPRATTIPTSRAGGFYDLVLDKLRVLDLIEYSRVLFLDSDVLPLCRLDYLLMLSQEGKILRENVFHAMYDDPLNAGLFVVRPRAGAHQQLLEMWEHSGGTRWNASVGWSSPGSSSPRHADLDYRYSNMRTGSVDEESGWNFYCANADQGLLLYWARVLLKESRGAFSMLVGPTIEDYSWSREHNETLRQVRPTDSLADYSCLAPTTTNRTGYAQNAHFALASQTPFYQDFYHMVGFDKAWSGFAGVPPLKRPIPQRKVDLGSSREYWYYVLRRVGQEFDLAHSVIPDVIEDVWKQVGTPKFNADLISMGK